MACLWKVDTLTQVFSHIHIAVSLTKPDWGERGRDTDEKNTYIEQINYFNSITNRNSRFPNKQPIQGTALTFLAKTEVTISAEHEVSTQKHFTPKKISPLGVTVTKLGYSMKL